MSTLPAVTDQNFEAEVLKAPVVHALRGKEFLEYDNPYDVGMTGLLGFSSGYHAMEHCDALLMLGTDFPYRTAIDHVKGLTDYGFSASDLQAIDRDNALRLLPKLRA